MRCFVDVEIHDLVFEILLVPEFDHFVSGFLRQELYLLANQLQLAAIDCE